jgi:peptidoglycan biosynthesis protein MviN/MurJ (putative lipid II flippase)
MAGPIVRVVFERKAFDASAGVLVTGLLQCYAIGAPIYLLRDVLVRAFYAQGDGGGPFWVSMAAIGINAFLDWYFITQFGLGAQGLVLATVLVNLASVILLHGMLVRKIGSLRLKEVWNLPAWLFISTFVAGWTAHHTYKQFAAGLIAWFTPVAFWLLEKGQLPTKLGHLAVWGADAGLVGLAAIFGLAVFLGLIYVFKSSPGGKRVWDEAFPVEQA